jgi:fibronectin type 3 domain-containing protein
MTASLEDLLKKERHLHGRLDSWMANMTMGDMDIEALGLQYEKCLADILDYTSTNTTELLQKLERVFDIIKRDYEDHDLLTHMKTSLEADIEALKTNLDFG